MTSNASPDSTRPSFYAWAVVALLFPVALLNYLDRMMVAAMRTSIRADIPTIANDADFGFLMALFMWVYGLSSPLGGFLADRFSRRWMVIVSLFIWSLMTLLTGFAHTFAQMAWTRSLMGLSEAFYIPAGLALIADFHPGPTRSRAVGLHMCGIYTGQALGGIGGYIADAGSWRNAFYWFGGAGLLYGIVLLSLLRDYRPPANESVENKSVRAVEALLSLLGTGSFLILVLYFTLPSIPGWAIKNWLPTFLAAEFNLKQGPAGMSALRHSGDVCRRVARRRPGRSGDAFHDAGTNLRQRARHGPLRAGLDGVGPSPDPFSRHPQHGAIWPGLRIF
jgi:MFS family permease